jgi:uncharacterized protein YbbC (DUF1343 family)
MHYEETGLPWVPPSPNMPHPATAAVYPGGCLVEGTNLSEGRGTTRPFETVGAPWLDADRLAASLRDSGIEGAVFRETIFRPMFQKHCEKACGGVFVHVTDRHRFSPFLTYLHLLQAARAQEPDAFDWRREPYEFVSDRLAIDLLLGQEGLREMIEEGVPPGEMESAWREGLEEFRQEREPFLLY